MNPSPRLLLAYGLPVVVLTATGALSHRHLPSAAANQAAAQAPSTVSILPIALPDIPGKSVGAPLPVAARFAWQEFIALNWPALPGKRDTPDTTRFFGTTGTTPLVWQTYRAKSEIYPGVSPDTLVIPPVYPHGYKQGPGKDYGYDQGPDYTYFDPVVPGLGKPSPKTPWVNLDEVSEIDLDRIYDGIGPKGDGSNTAPNLIRFMAKANRAEYVYVCKNGFWYQSAKLTQAQKDTAAAIQNQQGPQPSFVSFPNGTIEVKSAWRKLGPTEDKSRFYTTIARSYESGGGKTSRYYDSTWALIALHIIQKTPSGQSFVYATFEQADNILTTNAQGEVVRLEDENGQIIHPLRPGTPDTTPPLKYTDGLPKNGLPKVTALGPYCAMPGANIYYQNQKIGFMGKPNSGLPTGGKICINQRYHPIPNDVITVNKEAHAAIQAYTRAHGVTDSPWQYYKLVNVQAYPTNKPTNLRDEVALSTYYQANIVVESNEVLQQFSGRLTSNGVNTNLPVGGADNVYLFNGNINGQKSFNMGGCMGCHGNAQRGGSDFSFILGASVQSPETPNTPQKAKVIQQKLARLIAK